MSRTVWRVRVAFHEWMWSSPATLLRRRARRLPLWLSDPYAPSPRKFNRILDDGPQVYFSTARHVRVLDADSGEAWTVNVGPQTWVSGTTTSLKIGGVS